MELIKIDPIIKPKALTIKNVAAYARVSMECRTLQNSLHTQVTYYSELIQDNPNWNFVGIYSDYGISGRSIKGREDFQNLIADCEAGKIDLVLTKSISRFARNTLDCIETVRHLKSLGVEVIFEKDNLSTFSKDADFILTILASVAQEESRSISNNVRWSIIKRFENGIPNGHKEPYGYYWDGEMFRIKPDEGEIVREIFDRYLSGETAYSIAADLKKRGVRGKQGGNLSESVIKEIVTSDSYAGNMTLQKTYSTDSGKKKKNEGQLKQYVVCEMFEPLASKEEIEKARTIRKERYESMCISKKVLTPFSGKVVCGVCGSPICRRTAAGRKKWVCSKRENKGKSECDSRPIYEDELKNTVYKTVGLSKFDKVIVNLDTVEVLHGKKKKVVNRNLKGRMSVYSGKLICPCCSEPLKADSWMVGKAGKKRKARVWVCRGCEFKAVYEKELIKAVKDTLGDKDYEQAFIREIDHVEMADDKFRFIYRKGGSRTWQRK